MKKTRQNLKPLVIARQVSIVLLAILAFVFWLNQDRGTDLKRFCNDIARGTQYDDVISSAQSEGYSIPFYAREDKRLTFFNKSGMLFEYGCTVHFVDLEVVNTTYFEK